MSAPSIEREPAVTPSSSPGASPLAALAPRSTPAQLRLLMTAVAVVAVVFGVVASIGVDRREAALGAATDAAAQLIDVQSVQVSIARADVLASENYLRGGIEDPATRAAYVAELDAAGRGLVDVANRVGSADADLLGQVSGSSVATPASSNRPGPTTGRASPSARPTCATPTPRRRRCCRRCATSRRRCVTRSTAISTTPTGRAPGSTSSAGRCSAVSGAAGWWLSRRFRRLVNVPLAAAGLVAMAAVVLGGIAAASAMRDAEDATAGPLRSADLAAQARSAGFDAHAQEFFTLITRGNAAAAETAWAAAAANAQAAAGDLCNRSGDCEPVDRFADYVVGYEQVRALDAEQGDWDAAVALSLGDNAATFEAFDAASVDATERNTAIAIDRLSTSNDRLGLVRAGVFVAGLVVAALAVVGVGQRLREYR